MSDERQGLPSCSILERLHACPGSWALSQGIETEESEAASSGTLIHAFLAGETGPETLSEEEMQVAARCQGLLADLMLERGLDPEVPHHVERRFWLGDETGKGGKILSGKADLAIFYKKAGKRVALIVDYKTGRGSVSAASDNLQLLGLIACAAFEEVFMEAEVAIIQPWANPPVTVAHYDFDAIERAVNLAEKVVCTAMQDGGQTVVSGDHCRYCPAKATCPETRATVEKMAVTVAKRDHVSVLTPSEKIAFFRTCNAAIEIAESFKGSIKRELEANPDAIPGLRLKPGAIRTKVTDVAKVYGAINSRFPIVGPEFAAACSITKTSLKDLCRSHTGKKGKELDALLSEITEGAIEETQSSPSVEEVKP